MPKFNTRNLEPENMKNPLKKKLCVSIDPDVNIKLEEGAINKSKLINMLLKKYIQNFKNSKR